MHYILTDRGIENVGDWNPDVRNVAYISYFDRAYGSHSHQTTQESMLMLADAKMPYVWAWKGETLLFADDEVYQRFLRECPLNLSNARVASKRDRQMYNL